MEVPCHLFEHTIATYHPLGILDSRLANHPAPVGLPAALEAEVEELRPLPTRAQSAMILPRNADCFVIPVQNLCAEVIILDSEHRPRGPTKGAQVRRLRGSWAPREGDVPASELVTSRTAVLGVCCLRA